MRRVEMVLTVGAVLGCANAAIASETIPYTYPDKIAERVAEYEERFANPFVAVLPALYAIALGLAAFIAADLLPGLGFGSGR